MPAEPSRASLLRRNGKQRSCETCRKAKVACDHQSPTCGRCRLRALQCVYHPAPLTRVRNSIEAQGSARPPILPPAGGDLLSPTSSQHQAFTSGDPASSSPQSQYDATGFLGPTSYSAIYTEHATSSGIGPEDHSNALAAMAPQTVNDPSRIDHGARLLLHLKDISLIDSLADRWCRTRQGVGTPIPLIRATVQSLKASHGGALANAGEHELKEISNRICLNSQQPLRVPASVTASDYLDLFLGQNLRWEVLGILFTIAGASAMTISDQDTYTIASNDRLLDRKHLSSQMMSTSDDILSFCDHYQQPNELMLWLMFENFTLVTLHHGDSSLVAFRRLGDLCTTALAMGLHQAPNSRGDNSLFFNEFRKRAFAASYIADKAISTFLGRPQRISGKSSVCELPLDLSDDDLWSDDLQLQRAAQGLDERGWNLDNSLHQASLTRVRMLTSAIRDEVLELSLSTSTNNVDQQVWDLTGRLENMWKDIPVIIRYVPDSWNSGQSRHHCYARLLIHLDHFYNIFLLQRTLIRHTQTTIDALLDAAREILSTVLTLVNERDRLSEYQCDIAWNVSYYGLPSAGAIAHELLRQTQQPQSYRPVIPRSQTIQDLSVFVSSLQWAVRPGNGNYELCNQARGILARILDKILSPAPAIQQSVDSLPANEFGLDFPFFDPNLAALAEDVEFDELGFNLG